MPRYVVERTFPEGLAIPADPNELPVDPIRQVRVLDPYFHD